MTKQSISKAQSKKLISDLFYAIPYSVQHGFSTVSQRLFDLCVTAEKNHRKGAYTSQGSNSSRYNFPVADTARMFVVQYLFDGMQVVNGEKAGYGFQSILHIRMECLLGQAYAMENADKLQEWAKLVSDSDFAKLDYCELIA